MFIYFYYIHYRELDNPIMDQIINIFLTFIFIILAYMGLGFILEIPFNEMIPFDWHYSGLIHWCIFFFFFFHIANRRGMNRFKSFTLATLATVGGGWLYEIPIFFSEAMYISPYSVFYINGQIIYLLFLGYELMRMNFRPNKIIILMMLIFLGFSTALFIDSASFWDVIRYIPGATENLKWVYRIPASLFLLSLLSGINKQDPGDTSKKGGR